MVLSKAFTDPGALPRRPEQSAKIRPCRHEGLDLEDAGNEPQYEKKGFLEMGVSPIDAPDTPM